MVERIVEITIQARAGEQPEDVAQECVERLGLGDGVRLVVLLERSAGQPRRFVVHAGRLTSPRQWTALQLTDAVETLLRQEARALDAWEILHAARARMPGTALAQATVVAIRDAARLLVSQRRARTGSLPGTWQAGRADTAVA
jgi:hypothetical protein